MNLGRGAGRDWRRRVAISAVVFGCILFLIALMGYISQTGDAAGNRGARAAAPDFTFILFDGRQLALLDLQGKPVVLNFWASWCPPCRAEARGLERVWQAYQDKGVVFLGVDIMDNEEDARAFLQEFGITYPNGQDATNDIAAKYGVSGIPTTFFITKGGEVARRWVGGIGEKQLVAFIEEILL